MTPKRRTNATACTLSALLVAAIAAAPAVAAEPTGLDVQWNDDYTSLSFNYLGEPGSFAESIKSGSYPSPGSPPDIQFYKSFPVVAIRAKWTASTAGWPKEYRGDALDYVIMRSADADFYHEIYPKIIADSKITVPPEFVKEANAHRDFSLVEALRGKDMKYQITAMGGFGAKDYQIDTTITLGLSSDNKTAFFTDTPSYISDYLKTREYVFAAHDAGDHIRFDILVFCLCKPTWLKGETMKRVESSSRYLIDRMYKLLSDAPTQKEIDQMNELMKKADLTQKDMAAKDMPAGLGKAPAKE